MENGITIAALIEAAAEEGELVRKVIEDLHFSFKEDGRRDNPTDAEVNLAALARHVHYSALSLTEGQKSKISSKRKLLPVETDKEEDEGPHLTPAWKPLMKHYLDLWKIAGEKLALFPPEKMNDDHLSTLCYFKTRIVGSQKKNLYSSLALLIVHLKERGILDSKFLRYSLPDSERDFARDIGRYIEKKIEEERTGNPTRDYPKISITFKYDPIKLADLERFHAYFQNLKPTDADRCSHFICYRPRKSNPTEFIKTFLAIKPPEASGSNSKSFNFVHVYQATDQDKQRVALGKILPLHEGLYFVGGQKEHQPEDRAWKSPFKTLKVIAIGWRTIEVRDANIAGLVMSANNRGDHIVSRIILRATPFAHSKDTSLGAVKIKDLWQSLTDDARKEVACLVERKAPPDEFAKYGLRQDSDDQFDRVVAQRMDNVLAHSNNDAPWGLPDGFRAVKGRTLLTKPIIEKELEEMFGSSGNPKFQDSFSTPFEFPKSLRFGVLSKK